MQARILGSFQLEEGGRRLPMGGFRQRAVLVSLLLHANEVIPSEQLLMDLWGEDSPPSAANSLQAAISRLRRVLPQGRLITKASGYLLRIFPEELDVSQFEQLVSEGREALTAGAAEQAARTLRQALSLWQGPALADFRYEPFAQAEIVRLEELHLTCLEERVEAELALGSASVLVAELRRLVSEHPVRERLRGQLMLALYRDGRQAEALKVYREFRSVLRDELGLDPSPQLRELEAAILRHDSLVPPVSTATGEPLARRPVTVVCVLLRVASNSGTSLDPEAYEIVNEQSVSGPTAVLEQYGGKLAISADERLIGVFGAASVHEDDALRAVRASLEARRVLTSEMVDMLRRYGVSLTCRFGAATGEALVGGSVPLGSAGERERPGGDACGGRRAWPDPHRSADARTRRGCHRNGKRRSRSVHRAIGAGGGAPAGTASRCALGRPGRGAAPACGGLRRGQPRTGDHAGDGDRRGRYRQDAACL